MPFFLGQANFSQLVFGIFCGADFCESHPVHPVLHLGLSVSNCSIPFNNGQTPKLRDSRTPRESLGLKAPSSGPSVNELSENGPSKSGPSENGPSGNWPNENGLGEMG